MIAMWDELFTTDIAIMTDLNILFPGFSVLCHYGTLRSGFATPTFKYERFVPC